MKTLHPKIQELRNSVGYSPIREFFPNMEKYNAIPMEIRGIKTSEDERLIKQYFAIWGVPDSHGTMPMKGCFSKSLNERGPAANVPNKIVVLNQHNQRSPLCIPSILKEDEVGLYGEYTPDEGIDENDDLVIRVKKGTINNGSYGFLHVWDKMEYDEKTDTIRMYEVDLLEVSPVTFGSQNSTYVVRNRFGIPEDAFLEDDTESLIRQIPRKYHLELRSLIARHTSLAKMQPAESNQRSLDNGKPKQRKSIDYTFLNQNF